MGTEEELDKKREAEENRSSPLGGSRKHTFSHDEIPLGTKHLADTTVHVHDDWDQEDQEKHLD